MSREDEIDELIMYVTDMRHSFTRKLDDQLFIIQEQNDRIRQQQRTIDEQKEVVDELAWQIRDLRDSVRRVKESMTNGCLGCQANNAKPTVNSKIYSNVQQTQSSPPQAAPRRRGELVEDIVRNGHSGINNETVYARISFDPTATEPNNKQEENIYEYVEAPVPARQSSSTTKPSATEAPKTTDNRAADLRTRYALFKHSTFRQSDTSTDHPPVDATKAAGIEGAIEKQKLQLKAERESYEGAKTDEAVMLRLNALKRYPQISQLRGSSKTAAAFCLIADIAEETHTEMRHAASDIPTEARFPYGKGGSFRV